MKIAKLMPALLLIATVKLDIVVAAFQFNLDQFQSLKGQVSTSSCPPIVSDVEIVVSDPEDEDPEYEDSEYEDIEYEDPRSSGEIRPDSDTFSYYDLDGLTGRSFDLDYDTLPVNSIGRNEELNTINGTDSARNRQTVVIRQRLPARRGSQRRRRRPNRRRPSAEKRRRRNRHNSKDRRSRRRRGQRKGPRKEMRRAFVRRHFTNKRSLDESTAKNEQSQ